MLITHQKFGITHYLALVGHCRTSIPGTEPCVILTAYASREIKTMKRRLVPIFHARKGATEHMIALKNHRLLSYHIDLISFPSCGLRPKEAANANKRHRVDNKAEARFHPTSQQKHLFSSSQNHHYTSFKIQ